MTTCYEWFSFPNKFSVKCPECESESMCSNAPIVKEVKRGGGIHHELIDAPGTFDGDLFCHRCGLNRRETIHWPQDAYWLFDVRGKVLWAWSREHAEILLDFIESKNRKKSRYRGYISSLLHLPKFFQKAKNRGIVSKVIRNALEKNA